MKVPRSKVKTDYSRLLCCLVFVIESDLSVLLTHSIFALGFMLVAGRWRATGHSRAHGPTKMKTMPVGGAPLTLPLTAKTSTLSCCCWKFQQIWVDHNPSCSKNRPPVCSHSTIQLVDHEKSKKER